MDRAGSPINLDIYLKTMLPCDGPASVEKTRKVSVDLYLLLLAGGTLLVEHCGLR